MINVSLIIKTIGYRLSASLIAQITTFLIFKSIEINALVLLTDLIQMTWYYIYEILYNKYFKKKEVVLWNISWETTT